jgi:hypothetical protein
MVSDPTRKRSADKTNIVKRLTKSQKILKFDTGMCSGKVKFYSLELLEIWIVILTIKCFVAQQIA